MKKIILLITIINFLFINTNAQNNCLDFDGTEDYIDLSNYTHQTYFTFEAWIYPEADNGAIFIERVASQDIAFYVEGNQLVLGWWVGAATTLKGGTITQNKWNHVAGVWDGTTRRIYINGVSVADDTPTAPNTGGTKHWDRIGYADDGSWSGGLDYYFTGKIDEFRIWSSALNRDQIIDNMHKGLTGSESNLIVNYNFNETSGPTADNVEGTANLDGTLTNMTGNEWETSSAFFGPKYCLDFDGVNEYVDCGTGSDLNISDNTISMEAWIYPTDFRTNYWENTIAGNDDPDTKGYVFRYGGNGVLSFAYSDGSWQEVTTSNNALTLNKWQHVAVVYDGSYMKLYVDGIEKGSAAATSSISASGKTFLIGASWQGSRHMVGKIDELRIWSGARTISDLRENMCSTLNGNETGLVGYYNFDYNNSSWLPDYGGTYDLGQLYNINATNYVSSSAFNTWLDVVNTSWATTTNWSDGGVPTLTDNVGIPNYSGGSQPTLTSALACNNLVIGEDATLTFNYNGSHTIHGSAFVVGHSDITNNDFLTVTKNLYILFLASLDIDPGGQLTIDNDLDIWASGKCTIKSDASSTGSLIVNSSSSSINCERYLASGKWHYIAEPLNTSGNFNTLDLGLTAGAGNDQFYRWEESLFWEENTGCIGVSSYTVQKKY